MIKWLLILQIRKRKDSVAFSIRIEKCAMWQVGGDVNRGSVFGGRCGLPGIGPLCPSHHQLAFHRERFCIQSISRIMCEKSLSSAQICPMSLCWLLEIRANYHHYKRRIHRRWLGHISLLSPPNYLTRGFISLYLTNPNLIFI